jgi:two-component system, NarL family, response regulator DegU
MHSISILIADDHKLFRKSLVNLINGLEPNWKLLEASNGQEVLDILQKKVIDVVIMDVRMPVIDGVQAARELKMLKPEQKIIILSQYNETSLVQHLLSIGVNGFLLKTAEPEELRRAIRQVHYDGSHTNEIVLQALEQSIGHRDKDKVYLNFTPRDKAIIQYLQSGLNSKEIAKNMQLSEFTVDSYRKDLLHRTKTHNVAELISFAFRTGIL